MCLFWHSLPSAWLDLSKSRLKLSNGWGDQAACLSVPWEWPVPHDPHSS